MKLSYSSVEESTNELPNGEYWYGGCLIDIVSPKSRHERNEIDSVGTWFRQEYGNWIIFLIQETNPSYFSLSSKTCVYFSYVLLTLHFSSPVYWSPRLSPSCSSDVLSANVDWINGIANSSDNIWYRYCFRLGRRRRRRRRRRGGGGLRETQETKW